MAIDDAAAVGKLHQRRQHDKQRAEQHDAGQRAGHIETAFEHASYRRLVLAIGSGREPVGQSGGVSHFCCSAKNHQVINAALQHTNNMVGDMSPL
jgi:hypothetical protein